MELFFGIVEANQGESKRPIDNKTRPLDFIDLSKDVLRKIKTFPYAQLGIT
jgi:hypothetical protein